LRQCYVGQWKRSSFCRHPELQNYTYKSTSGVHGIALDSTDSFIYSTDDSANTLWTHKVNISTGEVTLVSSISGPVTSADPRHMATQPKGQYLYTILQSANQLAQYTIDQTTSIPSFENVTYSLIPADTLPRSPNTKTTLLSTTLGSTSSDYWSDRVALSYGNNYLWATSCARSANNAGYISAFSLAAEGNIIAQIFLNATTSNGETANSVAPG
jgi:carboxy-cis,cis-muconate cyclase